MERRVVKYVKTINVGYIWWIDYYVLIYDNIIGILSIQVNILLNCRLFFIWHLEVRRSILIIMVGQLEEKGRKEV